LEGRSNFSLGDAQNWHVTVVLLDMLNTPSLYQAEGKRRLIQYLSQSLQREEPTAMFGLRGSGMKQLHPFTTDTAVLIAALKKVREQVGQDEINEQPAAIVGDMAADLQTSTNETAQQVGSFLNDQAAVMSAFQQRDSIRTTLTAMAQIARAYGAIPGRKTLIWVSGGFPFMIDDPLSFARMGTDPLRLRCIERTQTRQSNHASASTTAITFAKCAGSKPSGITSVHPSARRTSIAADRAFRFDRSTFNSKCLLVAIPAAVASRNRNRPCEHLPGDKTP